MLGVSTSWRSEILNSGKEIVEEILSLGVQAVEVEYRMSKAMLKEILPMVEAGEIAVTSVHNIVPRPRRIPKEYADGEFVYLSAENERERLSAVKYATGTMEWAEKVGAPGVVLHMGKVRMDGVTEFLREIYDDGRIRSDEA
ncbi:MAG TPA: hypothetical protein VLS90_02030, partial [Thermodesulfobacteriota bacterium]|nr:hypothetical protein [Thermodesulfobacteriota bacterium]